MSRPPRYPTIATARPTRPLPAWSLLILLAFTAMLPLALFAGIALSERGHALAEAERSAVRTVWALHEHAAKVLETHEIMLTEVTRRIEGRPWDDMERDRQLWTDLSLATADIDYATSVMLVDAQGLIRMTTDAFPLAAGTKIGDQDSFLFHRDGGSGTYIGPARISANGTRTISISRRLPARPGQAIGELGGIVRMVVPVTEFTDFWKRFAPTIAHLIPLIRSDGQIIVRHPTPAPPERLSIGGPFLSRALAQREGTYRAISLVDGVERLNAFTRVKDYDLHISFSVETQAILAEWHERMEPLGLFSLLASAAMVAAMALGILRHRAQQAATERWRELAGRLATEMDAREQAEASLRRAQTLDAVGQLTAGVAHDFNNLLQALRGGLVLLRKPRSPESAHAIVDAGLQAVERGARLVRQLMVFARREQLALAPVALGALVAGMGDLLQSAAGPGVRIEAEIDADLDPAMADATQTELAILNLVINARDAMADAGTVTIAARNLHVLKAEHATDPIAPGHYVVVSIKDTGTGMTSDVLNRALEPFFTTKPVGKGTGLGLSMVHGLLSQSGGGVRIESEPGRGTTVNLYLPRAETLPKQRRPAAHDATPTNAHASEAATILLVDDDSLGRLMTATGLREAGHTVLEARDAADGLTTLRRHPNIDLLVTDYAMPGMNGVQLAETVKTESPSLPVIMITGQTAETQENLERMADAVLRKPFHTADLDTQIRTAIRTRTNLRAALETGGGTPVV